MTMSGISQLNFSYILHGWDNHQGSQDAWRSQALDQCKIENKPKRRENRPAKHRDDCFSHRQHLAYIEIP